MTSKLLKGVLVSTAMSALCGGAQAETLQVLRNNALTTVNSSAPATSVTSTAISGIGAGETLNGFDYRPANPRLLYGISNTGQVYAINGFTAAATAIGTPIAAAATPAGTGVGIDFNPTVDRIRFVTTTGVDLRINPATGALAATDGRPAYAGIDANAGQTPTIAGSAYTNNVAGATSTALYEIDTRGGTAVARLVTQGNANVSPNTGILFSVGSTGVTTTSAVGFDIARSGTAFATLTNPATGVTSLYTVNLSTGAATLVGALAGNTTYSGLAVALAPFQSMGTTTNQVAVGNTLDRFTGVPNAATLGLFTGIDGVAGTAGAQSAALLQLTPTAYSNLAEISLQPVEIQETTILRYTRDLRGNAMMPNGSTATLDEAGKASGWIVGGSRFGRYKGDVDRYGADTDEFHVLGGADFRLNPTIALGAYGGYSKVNAHLAPSGGAKGDLDSWFVGGYGTAAVGPLYVDGWGSYTHLDWDLARTTTVGPANTVLAQDRGRIWAAGAATGLSFQLGVLEVEPFGTVRYADVRLPGFSEIGAGPTGLTISDLDKKSLLTEAGARVGAKFEVAGAIVRPQVRGGWYHEFKNQTQTINAAFNNASSIATPFSFTTTPLRRNYYDAGAALNIAGGGKLSFTSDFDTQFDKDRRFYTLTIGIRLAM